MAIKDKKYDIFTKILANKAQCKLCKSIIESKHGHDFKQCSCGEIFIDGGKNVDSIRRGATDFENLIDISEFVPFNMQEIEDFIKFNQEKTYLGVFIEKRIQLAEQYKAELIAVEINEEINNTQPKYSNNIFKKV